MLLLLAVYIEFLASFIKLSHTILLPVCSLLLADCDDTRCGVTGAVFTTIFTVVLTYIISTVAVPGPATYSMLLALCQRGATPISPPPQPVDRLRTLGLLAPCRPVWSRDGDPGLRFVRRRGCRAGRRAKRKQTLSADRTCRSRRHRHPVIMSVHLQSSDVSTSAHFSPLQAQKITNAR